MVIRAFVARGAAMQRATRVAVDHLVSYVVGGRAALGDVRCAV
jgi:hypothetical protein